jgi:DNA-binding transcriptional MerR regulator
MPIERLRRYGELCRDPATIPERIALLREHAEAVEQQIDRLRRWRTRLDEKLQWYGGQLQDGGADAD